MPTGSPGGPSGHDVQGNSVGQDSQHPGSDYYVNPTTGNIQRQADPILAAGLVAAGYEGPFTWDQAKQIAEKGNPVKNAEHDVEDTGSAIAEVGHWIGNLVNAITDIYMWRSLGWLALGLALLVIGVLMLLRKDDLLPDVVPVPV